MTAESAQRVRKSYILLGPQFDRVSRDFYERLFAAQPDLRAMFQDDMGAQRQHLGAAMALIVRNLQMLDALAGPLADLGAAHARSGVRAEHYPIVRDAMIASMAEALTPIRQWSDELATDWRGLLEHVSNLMLACERLSPRLV